MVGFVRVARLEGGMWRWFVQVKFCRHDMQRVGHNFDRMAVRRPRGYLWYWGLSRWHWHVRDVEVENDI